MDSKGIIAFAQGHVSRGFVGRIAGSEVGASENEQHGGAIVAIVSEMEGRALLVIPCIDHSSCVYEHAARFLSLGILIMASRTLLCSEMEGRALLRIPCFNRRPCFRQHTTDFSLPIVCSEMEGCALLRICPSFNRRPCFLQHTTDISLPMLCSEMEGRALMCIQCFNRRP
jgi:hypothetical protein